MPSDLFVGDGEAVRLMRGIDWSATSLGPPELWPNSVRTVLPMMLRSRFAMRVLWGRDDLLMIYNDAYRPVLGASKHPAAMGRPIRESFQELWHIVGPMFARVLDGESIALEDTQLPLDRHGYLEESYFTLSYSPLAADDGAIAGVLGVVHETTERVLADRRLRTLRELSGSALAATPAEAAHEAIAVLARNPYDVPFAMLYMIGDAGSRVELVASCNVAAELAPSRVRLDGDPTAASWPLAAMPPAFTQMPIDAALDVRGTAYPERVTSAVVAPMFAPGVAQPNAYLVVGVNPRRALDEPYRTFLELAAEQIAVSISNALAADERTQLIARERAAREDAERSNRAKDEFLAIVSHELRNPMSAVLGWTRMLLGGDLPPDKQRRALETIERNALNQAQLIEDLLDVSRVVSGKLRLEVAPLSFEEVVRAAIDSARPALDAKQLRLNTVIDTAAVALMGDAVRLQQVVWNLLANAAKFTPKGGSIRIVITRVDSVIELEVTDSGKGISPDVLPYVFERFKQGDSSTTRTYGGLGLGLAISKSIVEMHGGTITARSDGEGRGATFVVRLPVSPVRKAEIAPPRPHAMRLEYPPEIAGLHVLVVDDDADGRDMLAAILTEGGTRVSTASSVAEAIAQFDRDRPDVLISDIGMPGEDGYALIRKVRARPPEAGGSVPAASLTAYASTEDRRRALLAGFNMHVPKPIDPGELVAVVASLGRFSRALR
jgi:signal transduction histidine kinase/CheY-like chemotaxis protein